VHPRTVTPFDTAGREPVAGPGHRGGGLPGILAAVLLGLLAGHRPGMAQAPAGSDPATRAIHVYQRYLSSMRHMHCRYHPSCSQYAVEAIARYGVVEGSARAADRLMRCNSSADSRYPRGTSGLLEDPVGGAALEPSAGALPDWLWPPQADAAPPVSRTLTGERRERLDESVSFARELESRGDCERASGEEQRAAFLADTLAAQAWAFRRAANCYRLSGDWYFADRAYLVAAMLDPEPRRRGDVVYGAAVTRFEAGAFADCAQLLADSALAGARDARSATLAGLTAIAAGDWSGARRSLRSGTESWDDTLARARTTRIAEIVNEGERLPRRSGRLAAALSTFLPGAGQVYAGHAMDGTRHLIFNSALVYTVWALASHGQAPGSVIVGGIALPFYLGNVIGAREDAERFNQAQRSRLLQRALVEANR
jgi:putative membrane protein insertion efficiency factor